MKLYVVQRYNSYEPSTFIGAYSSREVAHLEVANAYLNERNRTEDWEKEFLHTEIEARTSKFDGETFKVLLYCKDKYVGISETYELIEVALNETDMTEVF